MYCENESAPFVYYEHPVELISLKKLSGRSQLLLF